MELTMDDGNHFSHEFIESLPLADIPIPGITAKLLQAEGRQVLFMEFREGVTVPEHAHDAQWGVVLAGQLELTIDGKKQVYRKGDAYYIPKGASHKAKYSRGFRDVMIYDRPDRYRPK